MVSQKLWYCDALLSFSGMSLMTRNEMKSTPNTWHVCAIAADSMSTATASGKRETMDRIFSRESTNQSPVTKSPE